jgi:hypothetical protein
MERVRLAGAMRRRIGERLDDLQLLDDRAGPAVRDDQRERVLVPSWTVLASPDRAAGTDVIRSMAERAAATITEAEGSHVIMVSQPDVVADVILTAAAAVKRPVGAATG